MRGAAWKFLRPGSRPRGVRIALLLITILPFRLPAQNQPQADWQRYIGEAERLSAQGNYEAAVEPSRKALELAEKEPADKQPYAVSICLNDLAAILTNRGQYAQAEPLYRRALNIRRESFSGDPWILCVSLNNLADLYRQTGDYGKAQPLYEESYRLAQGSGGSSLLIARAAQSLGTLYQTVGDYDRAIPLYHRAVEICRFAFSVPGGLISQQELLQLSITYLDALRNLGTTYLDKGDLDRARTSLTEAYQAGRKVLGEEHPTTGFTLSELARLDSLQGRYRQAEAIDRVVFAIMAKRFGLAHSYTATALTNLAGLYASQGASERAEWMYEYALDIQKKALGPDHPTTANMEVSLAGTYKARNQYDRAEGLYREALAIQRRTFPAGHVAIATTLDGFSQLYLARGNADRAATLCQESLEIVSKTLGPEHPHIADILNTFGSIRMAQRQNAQAEQLYRRALDVVQKDFAKDHPTAGHIQMNLATLLHSEGKTAEAWEYFRAGIENLELNLTRSLDTGSELLKVSYLRSLSGAMDQLITYAVAAPEDETAAGVAFSIVLQHKGRVLESIAAEIAALRRQASPSAARLIGELAETRSALANLLQTGPQARPQKEYEAQLGDLARKEDKLQGSVSLAFKRSPGEEQMLTREQVQTALPKGSALVEFVYYRPLRSAIPVPDYDAPHYAAFVVLPSGVPRVFDLGPAAGIDELCLQFAASLSSPANTEQTTAIAGELYSAAVQKFAGLLPEGGQVFIAPDADLNLVPFSALRDAQKKFLVQRFRLVYLTAARDLLRLDGGPASTQPAAIAAAPDFGPLTDNGCHFEQRSGFLEEAAIVQGLFPGSNPLIGPAATKTALLRVVRPKLLLIATHGFFDKSGTCAPKETTPLLQAGLALAGANVSRDGILTALEITNWDLSGTQLVVLSSCESGLGDVFSGDGVFGMRRALAIAGARSQLLTLWKVDDRSTSRFMAGFFELIAHHRGRSEALQTTQLQMLNDGLDPYYWAGFVQSGDWRPIAQ